MQNLKAYDLCFCCDGGVGKWGVEGSSGSGAFLRALILLSEKWRHFRGQSSFVPAAPWAGKQEASSGKVPQDPHHSGWWNEEGAQRADALSFDAGGAGSCSGARGLVRGHVPCVRDAHVPPRGTGPGEGRFGSGNCGSDSFKTSSS